VKKGLFMGIKDRVRKIINEKCNGSNEVFARHIKINVATLQKWDDDHFPNGDKLNNIHNELGVNINWLLTGEGEAYIEKVTGEKEGRPHLEEQVIEYQKSTSTLGKAVDMLAAVLNSGNQVFIQALMSNLIAFSNAVKIDQNQRQEIAMMKSELEQVHTRLAALEETAHKHQEPVPSHIENTKKEAM
jgi:hypothetical protein